MNKYTKVLEEIKNNPIKGQALVLGIGCDRVAYEIDGMALKVGKVSMLPFNEVTGYYEIPQDIEPNVFRYYEQLHRDYGGGQTDEEVNVYESLTPEEKKLFNPIIETGEFNGENYTVSPLVTSGEELDYEYLDDLCYHEGLDFDFDLLDEVAKRLHLDYDDMVTNSGNFGINAEGQPVILDYGMVAYF